MKCEDCLPLIEEFVDGELDGRTAERLGAHLSACAACSEELSALRHEQELYASYRRDLEVKPAHWNIVRARIEQERDAAPPPEESRPSLREWLNGLFTKSLRPAFIAALALVAVATAAAVIYLRSREDRGALAVQTPVQGHAPTPSLANTQDAADGKNESGDENVNKGGGETGAPLVAKNPSRKAAAAVRARAPRSDNQAVKRPTPDGSAGFEEAASTPSGVRVSAPEAAGEFDFELARHAGRAELLLRSFRNVRPATASARALDVSFEKEQARKLLYRNIALRRAAAERGDPSAAALLNTLEPILLDIANLPGRAKTREVQSIERRMEKKEIVAALQVGALLASN